MTKKGLGEMRYFCPSGNISAPYPFQTRKDDYGMDVRLHDLLTMKKPHPCGAKEMLVLRTGMDFRLRCTGCGREFMVPRHKIEKNIRQVTHQDEDAASKTE